MPSMASQLRIGILPFLSLILPAVSQSIPGASLFTGGGIPGSGSYELVDDYQPRVFFSKFNFYNSYDPTYGHVQYVNESVAVTNGYATTNDDSVTISVDTTNVWPNGGPGRPSVRLISDNTYTHGLFILDLTHMPYGCGTWPAFWLLGPNWPANGEIDIIEGVHTSETNTVSMHTSANCTIAGSGQTGLFTNANCDEAANSNSGCGSMANDTLTPNNYGQGLSDNDGGVYITEWTSAYVRVWFFPRDSIPSSVTDGSPDVSEFGLPMANFQGSCDIDSHFANHSIIINTDFCGAWAGFAYSNFPNCPLTSGANGYDSCVDFVGNNPQNFTQAYWEINSIRVYQLPVNVSSSSVPTSITPLTSSSPISVSGSIINPGMGQSTSSLPLSVPYTGPLSSVSSTVSSTATALATPLICFPYDGKNWTDYNGMNYTISCGYDLTGQSLNGDGQTVDSFEACIELCDNTVGCGGLSHVGGNGAGTCTLKTGEGQLEYDGHTFVAVSVLVIPSASSTLSTMTATIPLSSTPPQTATLRPTAQASTCPEANNSVYVDENVVSYNVYRSSDTNVETYNDTVIQGGGFAACCTICDVTAGCVGFAFEGTSAGTCHFKNQFGSTSSAASDSVVAFLSQGPNSTLTASAALSTASFATNSGVLLSLSAYETTSVLASSSSSSMSSGVSATTSNAALSSSSESPTSSLSSSVTSSLPLTASSASPQIIYYVAPPCPSSVDTICNSNTPVTCSNAHGANFNVACGSSYTGTTIDDNSRVRIIKRVAEPSYTDCLDLCNDTPGCVGVNYKGDECTLFSNITGTVPDPGNVAATLLPPVPITSTSAATSSPTVSTLPTSSSISSSSASTTSSSSVISSAASSTASSPVSSPTAGPT
ncbi:glycoside hydrolase family 16 protein, partial [Aureobasidium melanogenum]